MCINIDFNYFLNSFAFYVLNSFTNEAGSISTFNGNLMVLNESYRMCSYFDFNYFVNSFAFLCFKLVY